MRTGYKRWRGALQIVLTHGQYKFGIAPGTIGWFLLPISVIHFGKGEEQGHTGIVTTTGPKFQNGQP